MGVGVNPRVYLLLSASAYRIFLALFSPFRCCRGRSQAWSPLSLAGRSVCRRGARAGCLLLLESSFAS